MNQKSTMSLQFLTVLTAIMSTTWSFPHGAPDFACKSLKPQHLGAPLTQQRELSPYSVTASHVTLAPGASTVVKVSSKSTQPDDAFRGFLCSASLLDDPRHETLGTMATMQEDTKTLKCRKSTDNTGITHKSKDHKWDVNFRWTAPGDAQPDIQYKIRCVVVQSIQKCWNDFQINITISSAASNTDMSENDTSSTTVSPTQPTPTGSGNVTQTAPTGSEASPGANTDQGSNDASTLNVSVTQSTPTGSGLSTEGVAMSTSVNTETFLELNETTQTPILNSTQNLPIESSTGSGPPRNESVQNESTPVNLVTSTPTTSVGPLPVRERNSNLGRNGRGPSDAVVIQSSLDSRQTSSRPPSQTTNVVLAQSTVTIRGRGQSNNERSRGSSSNPTENQRPNVIRGRLTTTVNNIRRIVNPPQVSTTGNVLPNRQQTISDNRHFVNQAPNQRANTIRGQPQTTVNSRRLIEAPRFPTSRNSFANNQQPSQTNQRASFVPRQPQTSVDFRSTIPSRIPETRNTFDNFGQNRFPQSVAAVNVGNRELVVFNMEDLIPFMGTDVLARLGFDTRNMVSFNGGNRNMNMMPSSSPSLFNPNFSSRFDNTPSINFGNTPSRNFGNTPSRPFVNTPSRNFGNTPSRNFGNTPSRNFVNTPSRNFGNTPSRNFDSFGRINNFVSERPLIRTTQTFVDPNPIDRNAIANVINRNTFNSNQPTTIRNNNLNTFQPTNTQSFGNTNVNTFQPTNTRNFRNNNNVNTFQPTNTRSMNSMSSNQATNQFRFPTRRSRMIDLINSSQSIRAPTFNNNFF